MDTETLTKGDAPWVKSPDEVMAAALQQISPPSPGNEDFATNREFFVAKSLAELAREQGVGPVKDISVFAGGFPEDENLDELFAELELIRGS